MIKSSGSMCNIDMAWLGREGLGIWQ